MRRCRVLVLGTALSLLAGLMAPAVHAAEQGGKAAGAARFIGHAVAPSARTEPASSALGTATGDSLVADAAIPNVPIFDGPNGVEPARSMKNPTREGVLLVFGVLEEQGDWLKVMLPMRPNGSIGWIKSADVRIRKVPNRIEIDRSDRMIRVLRGEETLFESTVAVGKSQSPTPLGRSYVDIAVPFSNPSGAYGSFLLSVAAYSEVLTNFGGGVGQIAIHGTSNLGSIGKDSSNGCIRLSNNDIMKLKELAPTGTPVNIVA
ncbi:MAG: L,D-transpeptidase [Actinomycetota bacterium]